MATNSDIDRVRETADLVALIGEHIPLRPKGREHVGVCPFHDDHSPSLTVVTHKGNAFYKCHACGASGDVFNFVMDYHKMPFPEALRYLAERTGVTLTPVSAPAEASAGPSHADLRRANELAAAFYRDTLKRGRHGAEGRAMIAGRGIDDETAEAFMIGAAPAQWDELVQYARGRSVSRELLQAAGLVKPRSDGSGGYDAFRNRLIFPICDELGRPVAFGGRRLDPEDRPKYLNSPDSPLFNKSRTLYGLHLAKRAVIEAGRAIVTEGYTDVVACYQAGLRNVVATLGTALTRDHVRMLKRICGEVVLVFDGDEAGQRAADRAVELFFAVPVDVRICVLPESCDPAEMLGQPDGLQRFRAALEASHHALDYKVRRFRGQLEAVAGLGARHRCLEALLADLATLGFASLPGVRKAPVLERVSELLGVPASEIERALPRGGAVPGPVVTAGAEEVAESALFEPETASATPARRRAEHELLAALIFQPSLRHQPVDTGDRSDATVLGRVRPEQFLDPAARRIAGAVWSRLEADEPFTVQQLMSELDHPQIRKLVGDLYFEAQEHFRDEGQSAVEHFRERVAAVERLVSRDRYQQDLEALRRRGASAGPEEALRQMVEQRRKQGYIPEALPLRARS
ncbi:MAG: DNA primase [Planctomycetota bacterium]